MIVLLAGWRLLLVIPLTALLRVLSDATFPFVPFISPPTYSVNAAGDWLFRIPAGGSAVEFTAPLDTIQNFTFALPIYWAVALALPPAKRDAGAILRPLLIGTAIVLLGQQMSLLTFVETSAGTAVAQLHPGADPVAQWLRQLSTYLAVFVAPFLIPFVAVGIAPGYPLLRSCYDPRPRF